MSVRVGCVRRFAIIFGKRGVNKRKWLRSAAVILLVVFQSFFGVPNQCSLHSSLSFSLDSGVDCAAQIPFGRIKTKETGF